MDDIDSSMNKYLTFDFNQCFNQQPLNILNSKVVPKLKKSRIGSISMISRKYHIQYLTNTLYLTVHYITIILIGAEKVYTSLSGFVINVFNNITQ